MRSLSPLPLSSHAKAVDVFEQASELERELKRTLKGEVRFDRGSRALYATDGSNYRQIPIGLVIPRDDEDVTATLAACRKYGAPVLPRGAGTSLASDSQVYSGTPQLHYVITARIFGPRGGNVVNQMVVLIGA